MKVTLALLLPAILCLFISCDSTENTDGGGEADRVFSEYKIFEMKQKGPGEINYGLHLDFESGCANLLKDGWIPAGGVSIERNPQNGDPMSYTQAFYR